MFHSTPQDSGPPPDPSEGHERTDIAAKPIVIFLICLVVFGGVVQASMSWLMLGHYVPQDTKAPTPPDDILRDTGDTSRPAPLQQDTTRDMIRMYDEEDRVLKTYHVDPKTKAIRIPLDRAVEVVAKKGLPHRTSAPKDMPAADPIPRAGKAYQATN